MGEIVKTIPSMGYNIETVDVKTASNKPFRMTGWDIGRGSCGYHDYNYGLIRLYTAAAEAIIWVVDSSDRNAIPESVDALIQVLSGLDKDRIATKTNTIPILMLRQSILIVLNSHLISFFRLANKSDKPNAMSLDEMRINFSKAVSGHITSIFRTTLTSDINPTVPNQVTGLPEAFDWLLLALEISKNAAATRLASTTKPITIDTKSLLPDPRSSNTLSQKLESWLTRTETDFPPEEFLAKFQSFTLPSWDHYTHIRIAYVMLTKYGRKDGKRSLTFILGIIKFKKGY